MGSGSKCVIRECDNCGGEIRAYGHRKDTELIFCSKSCEKDHYRKTKECAYCGEVFEVLKSMEGGEKNTGKYCSSECRDKWRSENHVGENNPLFVDSSVECDWCGSEFQKRPAKIEMYDKNFCSRSCHGEWISENNTGENHPRWKGGDREYGENWYEQRRKALERDNHTCQDCGRHESEVSRLHVHHITPLRDFDVPENANGLNNLLCLCISCHHKWEGLYLRPDTT